MADFPSHNPRLPEVNNTNDNPLKDVFNMLLMVVVIVGLLSVTLALTVGKFAHHIPFSWEQALVEKIGEHQSITEMAGFTEVSDPAAQQALNDLGQQIVASSDLPEGMTIHFHLVQNSMANAFATIGGHVFVTTGLIQLLSSENALAMVLGHEVAHVKHRHPIRVSSQGLVLGVLLTAAIGGKGAPMVDKLVGGAGMVSSLHFNRKMESESDASGIAALENHYQHVAGSTEFFEKMLEMQDSLPAAAEFFSSHPLTDKRINALREMILDNHWAVGELKPLPPALKQIKAPEKQKEDVVIDKLEVNIPQL